MQPIWVFLPVWLNVLIAILSVIAFVVGELWAFDQADYVLVNFLGEQLWVLPLIVLSILAIALVLILFWVLPEFALIVIAAVIVLWLFPGLFNLA
jgi:hypothetical protein